MSETPLQVPVDEAARLARVSRDTIRRAIHTTDDGTFPPPLKAHRLGPGGRYLVLVRDLDQWCQSLARWS